MLIRQAKNKREAMFEGWVTDHGYTTFRCDRGVPAIVSGKMAIIINRCDLDRIREEIGVPIIAVTWTNGTVIISPRST